MTMIRFSRLRQTRSLGGVLAGSCALLVVALAALAVCFVPLKNQCWRGVCS